MVKPCRITAEMDEQRGKFPHGYCGGGITICGTGGTEGETNMDLGCYFLFFSIFCSLYPPSFFVSSFSFPFSFPAASSSSLELEGMSDLVGMEVLDKVTCHSS